MRNLDWLPIHIQSAALRYIEEGRIPGSFLQAVLSNDLWSAFAQADEENREKLFQIVCWWNNEAPGQCWGSKEKMRAWASHQGLAQNDKMPDDPDVTS